MDYGNFLYVDTVKGVFDVTTIPAIDFHCVNTATIASASKAAYAMMKHASKQQRVSAPLSELWVSTKCGESDTTSGCASNPTVGNAFDKL